MPSNINTKKDINHCETRTCLSGMPISTERLSHVKHRRIRSTSVALEEVKIQIHESRRRIQLYAIPRAACEQIRNEAWSVSDLYCLGCYPVGYSVASFTTSSLVQLLRWFHWGTRRQSSSSEQRQKWFATTSSMLITCNSPYRFIPYLYKYLGSCSLYGVTKSEYEFDDIPFGAIPARFHRACWISMCKMDYQHALEK